MKFITFASLFPEKKEFIVSALKNKSEINLQAAKVLKEEALFPPSVHCSYYSVLQYMKYAVSEAIGVSYELQDREINALKTQRASAKGTHEYLIMKVGDVIRDIDRLQFTDFTRKVSDLKKFRTKSDYDDVEVSAEQSNKAYGLASELRLQLKNTFNV